MKRLCLSLSLLVFSWLPQVVSADVIYVATATTSDGAPLNSITLGSQVILDIRITTEAPGQMHAISASVNDYDTSIVSFNSAPIFSRSVLYSVYIPSVGRFNGVYNSESEVVDTSIQGPGQEDTFLSILTTADQGGDGSNDPTPAFRLIYDVVGLGSTALRVGTFRDYADDFTGVGVVRNTAVSITVVPEPTTALLLGLGLATLAAKRKRA